MTDFSFTSYVSRDELAAELSGNPEQAAYVLAEVADFISPSTMMFDDLCDSLDCLSIEQRAALAKFTARLAKILEPMQ